MVYYKVILDDRRIKSDNVYPVIVRVTHNRKNTSLSLGVRVDKEHWNSESGMVRSGNANYQHLNQSISEAYLKIQKVVLQLEAERVFSFEELKERLAIGSVNTVSITKNSFNDFAEKLIADMFDANQTGNATIYQTAVNRLLGFVNQRRLKFTDLNYIMLESFKSKLTKEGIKPNSISNYFRTLRAIYNKAIKAKLVDRSHYPFLDVVVKTEKTAKRAIPTPNIVTLFTTATKLKYSARRSKDYATLCFALRGISFTDLAYLKHENIKNGVLTYRRRKTNQELNIKLLPLAIELISKYNRMGSKYLLPVLPNNIVENGKDAKRTIGQWIKTTNKWLNLIAAEHKLNVDVTTYVIRHTWATTAKRLGYSNELIAECMGHEYGNKITNIYLDNFEQSVIDEVNERVVGVLNT